MKRGFIVFGSETIEPEIVSNYYDKKTNFLEILLNKIKKVLLLFLFAWFIVSVLFVFLGIALSTTLIGFILGFILTFMGVLSLLLFFRFLWFLLKLRRIL